MKPSSKFRLIPSGGSLLAEAYELNLDEVLIGRDPDSDLLIAASGVSSRHARLVRKGNGYWLEDLGSRHGTFLNDRQLTQSSPLRSGDRIRFGTGTSLVYEAPDGETGRHGGWTRQKPEAENGPDPIQFTLEGSPGSPGPEKPAQLVVTIAGDQSTTYTLVKDQYEIGSSPDSDIPILSPIVSPHHARLERDPGGYRLVVLPETANPVLYQGKPVKGDHRLKPGDTLRIGSLDPGQMVSLVYSTLGTPIPPISRQIEFNGKELLHIGRDPSNDAVLDAPTVSRFHAQIRRVGQRYHLRDLHSSQGIFVNNQRVIEEAWLKPNDQLRIGPYQFVLGQDRLLQVGETVGLGLGAIRLNKWVRKDLNILKDVSLVVQPGEFIAVVGQSGGGKSTLVDAISGYRPATNGRVVVNGVDIYQHFGSVRNDIGFVPQRDIIHMELTVYQALDYAARLRMPSDTTPEERRRRVMEVMDDLDLTHRRDVQVCSLSGGQQKRVSIGVELLTRPGLFFLDEPTSGLDPGTETALMHLLRRLADRGHTIILITHATRNVLLADKIVFMARGGYMAWFGPPEEALDYFDRYRSERDRRTGRIEFDEIYAILEDPARGSSKEWAKRYQQHPASQKYIAQPLREKLDHSSSPALSNLINPAGDRPVVNPQKISSLQQFHILFSRNLRILTRDRLGLLLLLLAPVLIGLMDILFASLLGRNPFDSTTGSARSVLISMFLLTVYCLMIGSLTQMREIVKEQDIYKRERLVVLRIFPYVFSKFSVAVLLSLYQAAAFTLIHYAAFKMPGGVTDFLLIYGTLVIACLASMMLGLFVSALAPNAVAAPLILILVVLPHLVLNGGLVSVPPTISIPIYTHWTVQGLMGISGIGSDVAGDICWELPKDVRKMMTVDQKGTFGCRCLGLAIFQHGSCNFPGVRQYYSPAVDSPAPVAPPPLGPPPVEPALPSQPAEPADKTDPVAVADYLARVKTWQAQVSQIQAEFKQTMGAYQKQAEIYNAEMIAYQQSLVKWQFARESAVRPAETIIEDYRKNYGWTLMNKNDPASYREDIATSWLAQAAFITIMFTLILLLQKRKDVLQ